MSLVRLAGPEDEAALFDLLMGLRDDNNRGLDFEVSEARVVEAIHAGTRQKGGLHGVIYSPDDPSRLAASIGALPDRWWFSSGWGLSIIWCYVREEDRAGGHYHDALIDWIKEMRADLETAWGRKIPLVDAVVSQQRLDAKLRLWRRHGGKLIGGIFQIS